MIGQNQLIQIGQVIITLIIALLMGGIAIELSGKDALNAYGVLFTSALSDWNAVANTLLSATPLIFSGLGAAIAFRAGVFNIGVEGSIYVGAFASAWVGFTFVGLPALIIIPLAFIVGAGVGGAWCYVPGALRARLGVDEIVTTIMLNYVAILLTGWLVNYPFRVPGLANAMSAKVAPAAQLPRIAPPSQLNVSFFIAVACALILAFVFRRMRLGYELRNTGDNPVFARWSGVPVPKVIEKVMFISGMMGGLAGAGQALGVNYRFIAGFSSGLGFTGIAIALLARNNPFGVLIAGLLFGVLRNGSSTMELFTDVPYDIVRILEAVIILFASVDLIKKLIRRKRYGIA
jgi:simple sugar transport system permease protein